jgi:hypothetical protein
VVACERDSAASFRAQLEASTFEVPFGSLWHPPLKGVQGGVDDHENVAFLPCPCYLFHPNLVSFFQGKTTPLANGFQGDACKLG